MSLLSHHELCKTVCSSGSLCPCVSHRVLRGVQSLAHQRHHYSRFSPGVQPAPITDGARSADGKAGRLPSVLLRQTPPYFALLILGCQKKRGQSICTLGAGAGAGAGQPRSAVRALPGVV